MSIIMQHTLNFLEEEKHDINYIVSRYIKTMFDEKELSMFPRLNGENFYSIFFVTYILNMQSTTNPNIPDITDTHDMCCIDAIEREVLKL